jgi:hypothetical protein
LLFHQFTYIIIGIKQTTFKKETFSLNINCYSLRMGWLWTSNFHRCFSVVWLLFGMLFSYWFCIEHPQIVQSIFSRKFMPLSNKKPGTNFCNEKKCNKLLKKNITNLSLFASFDFLSFSVFKHLSKTKPVVTCLGSRWKKRL